MFLNIMSTIVFVSVVLLVELPGLKKSNLITRWLSIGILLVSGMLWLFLQLSVNVPRPAEWLSMIFSPWSPVP